MQKIKEYLNEIIPMPRGSKKRKYMVMNYFFTFFVTNFLLFYGIRELLVKIILPIYSKQNIIEFAYSDLFHFVFGIYVFGSLSWFLTGNYACYTFCKLSFTQYCLKNKIPPCNQWFPRILKDKQKNNKYFFCRLS